MQGRVAVVVGDITAQKVDAVVNAANSTLLGGGGVDGAIHARGGPRILEECEALRRTRFPRGLPAGEAVATGGGLLPARYVIHTVGPIWDGRHGGEEAALLAACYRNSLLRAVELGLTSVAFPSISTGAYGYPRERAAVVASETITEFLSHEHALREVRLVFFTSRDARVFLNNHAFTS